MKLPLVNKTFIFVAAINLLLAILIIFVAIFVFRRSFDLRLPEIYLLPVIALLALSGAVATISMLRPFAVLNIRLRQVEATLEDLNKLNNTMRSQRHDFMNHLQVVYSLMDLGEHKEANAYIDKVYDQIEKVSTSLKTSIPAVNAILEAKRQGAENKDIHVSIDISSTLSGISTPDWQLCKLFGNIIDNSITALTENQIENPQLGIELFEDIHAFKFRISNNGPSISQDLWDKIFEAGVTTRLRDGEGGMGLFICKTIVEKHMGKLWVISDDVETVFEGFIPR